MSLACVKLQRTAVEKRTNKKKKEKMYTHIFFEKHNRDNDHLDKKGGESVVFNPGK